MIRHARAWRQVDPATESRSSQEEGACPLAPPKSPLNQTPTSNPNSVTPSLGPRRRGPLALAWFFFGAWLVWLAYLAINSTHPIVLSRPQFLVSSLDAVVDWPGNDAPDKIVLRRVLWPADGAKGAREGEPFAIANAKDCLGWEEPGLYLVPLIVDMAGGYQVVRTPASPGFEPLGTDAGKPRVYPWNEQTQRQYRELRKPGAGPLQ